MFHDTYLAELEALARLCDELGETHPQIASLLGRGADEGVSRIMQNVAFQAARLRARLQDDLPELIHPVVENLCPELLRPLPASTMMELLPTERLKASEVVPANSIFSTRPVDGAPCFFRSVKASVVRPWAVESVVLAAERRELRVRLQARETVTLERDERIALFLALPIPSALLLRSVLLRSTTRVAAGVDGNVQTVSLAAPPVAIEDRFLLLRSYFTAPEAFAFVEVSGLVGSFSNVELVFRLAEAIPKELTPSPRDIRVNVVQAVNLHRRSVKLPIEEARCPLRVAGSDIYTVKDVIVIRPQLTGLSAQPFFEFPPKLHDEGALLYQVHRNASVIGGEVDVTLAFVNGEAALEETKSLEATLEITDGERASRLPLGSVCVTAPGSPANASFRDITPVRRSIPSLFSGDRAWHAYQLVKANVAAFLDLDMLNRALEFFNLAAAADWPDARKGPLTLGVQKRNATLVVHDKMFQGLEVTVTPNVDAFFGDGDVELFGEVLATFLASRLRQHEFVRLTFVDEDRVRFQYPIAYGTREGL